MKIAKKRVQQPEEKSRISRQDHVCPFMKKTCIGCAIYRGRHSGLWAHESHLHRFLGSSEGNRADWIDSLSDFFRDARIIQGEEPDESHDL